MSKNGINTAFEPPESFAAQNSQTAAYPEDFSDSDYAGSDLSGSDLSDSGFPSSDFPSFDSSNSKNKDVRRIIELLGSKLTLPAAKKALGFFEGEHSSGRSGSGVDFLEMREYVSGEEARMIDWKASARLGKPMVADKDRNVNSEIWMLADTGREMSGICPGGEKQADVAMNALRMFAMLSLRRSDDVSLVLSGENSIIRHRISGGYAAFDRIAKKIAEKNFTHERDLNSLIEYAKKIRANNCLIVIATDDSSWSKESLKGLEILAQTHPLVIICTETFNPFKPDSKFKNTVDGKTGKKLPAFMKTAALAKEVDRHRKFISAALERKMAQIGAFMLYADSSETMSKQFIRLVCASQNSSKHFGGANISRKDNAA